MQYKRTDKSIKQIANELGGVDYIPEGSARRESEPCKLALSPFSIAIA